MHHYYVSYHWGRGFGSIEMLSPVPYDHADRIEEVRMEIVARLPRGAVLGDVVVLNWILLRVEP